MNNSLIEKIMELKHKHKAIILAHYYEDHLIQDIADFVGDSYQLATFGQKSSAEIILLAGVVFMAESVKILNPKKKVIVPDLNAGCSLVDSSPFEKYQAWKSSYPNSVMVTYINSSAEVKSISDVIVTSSNAETIIRSISEDRTILFGPDRNLGRYLMEKTGRKLVLWEGTCQVHVLFSAQKLLELIMKHPQARILAHPECDEDILKVAHVIGSTSRLLDEVKNHPAKEFIIATEFGIFHQMQKVRADALLIQAPSSQTGCACNQCPYMKLNTLEKIAVALSDLSPEIKLSEDIIQKCQIPLERMIRITQGGAFF